MSERVRNNAMSAIPDDPEQSTYRFIIVAAKRARQLQNGARSFSAHHVQKADHRFDGRSPARAGEVRRSHSRRAAGGAGGDRLTASMNAALGVGGGIAAYKSAELARALMERGVRVQVVMTRAAQEFIKPLTFAALTGNKVVTDIFATGVRTRRWPARWNISRWRRRTTFWWSRRPRPT